MFAFIIYVKHPLTGNRQLLDSGEVYVLLAAFPNRKDDITSMPMHLHSLKMICVYTASAHVVCVNFLSCERGNKPFQNHLFFFFFFHLKETEQVETFPFSVKQFSALVKTVVVIFNHQEDQFCMLDASPRNVICFMLPGCCIEICTTFDKFRKVQT